MTALRHGTPLKKLDEKEKLTVTGGEHVYRPPWIMNEYIEIGRAWARRGLKEALRVREELTEDLEDNA